MTRKNGRIVIRYKGGIKMKFKEFLNTCQNELTSVNVYYDLDTWEDMEPEFVFDDMRDCDSTTLSYTIDAWFIDANFSLHVLLSI